MFNRRFNGRWNSISLGLELFKLELLIRWRFLSNCHPSSHRTFGTLEKLSYFFFLFFNLFLDLVLISLNLVSYLVRLGIWRILLNHNMDRSCLIIVVFLDLIDCWIEQHFDRDSSLSNLAAHFMLIKVKNCLSLMMNHVLSLYLVLFIHLLNRCFGFEWKILLIKHCFHSCNHTSIRFLNLDPKAWIFIIKTSIFTLSWSKVWISEPNIKFTLLSCDKALSIVLLNNWQSRWASVGNRLCFWIDSIDILLEYDIIDLFFCFLLNSLFKKWNSVLEILSNSMASAT